MKRRDLIGIASGILASALTIGTNDKLLKISCGNDLRNTIRDNFFTWDIRISQNGIRYSINHNNNSYHEGLSLFNNQPIPYSGKSTRIR